MDYYSARLVVICLVDDGKPQKRNMCDFAFIIFRARDYFDAFERALALGKRQETTYKNVKGQKVRWALARIDEIKKIGRTVDGCEVGSLLDFDRSDKAVPFRHRFRPGKHEPLYS